MLLNFFFENYKSYGGHMKITRIISVIILSIFILSTTILANQELDPIVKAKYKTIEANLLVGLNSDNEGLKISCAYYLG